MNALPIRHRSWRPLLLGLVAALALVMAHGRAAAQIAANCPEFPVTVIAHPSYGTLPFPIDVGLNYTSLSGAPHTFTGNGSFNIPLVPGQGAPINVYINLPDGSHITIPLNGTSQFIVYPYTDPVTGKTFTYYIDLRYDKDGCPYLVIRADVLEGAGDGLH